MCHLWDDSVFVCSAIWYSGPAQHHWWDLHISIVQPVGTLLHQRAACQVSSCSWVTAARLVYVPLDQPSQRVRGLFGGDERQSFCGFSSRRRWWWLAMVKSPSSSLVKSVDETKDRKICCSPTISCARGGGGARLLLSSSDNSLRLPGITGRLNGHRHSSLRSRLWEPAIYGGC